MSTIQKQWSDFETNTARRLKSQGMTYVEIAEYLGRPKGSVQGRCRTMRGGRDRKVERSWSQRKASRAEVPTERDGIPECVLEERDRRLAASVTLSCVLLGDPPPGFSALDRR